LHSGNEVSVKPVKTFQPDLLPGKEGESAGDGLGGNLKRD